MANTLPSQNRGLVLKTIGSGLNLETIPVPTPSLGSAVVRILHAGVLSYLREIYGGQRQYPVPTPLVGGLSAVARIVAVPEDAVSLKPGQLVFIDCMIRGRDDPDALYMRAIYEGATENQKNLSRGVWRNGTFAEYANAPLESCIPLNEIQLCQNLGYSTLDLTYLCNLLVPYGGLRDIGLEPGETVIIAPATGPFGGAGVQVAIAMGARVIAMGRNVEELARIKAHVKKGTPNATVETVKITGDEKADTAVLQAFGTIDAVLDLSPPAAAKSTHFASAVMALRRNGRCSMMGFVEHAPSSWKTVGSNITMKGKLMYERDDMIQMAKMLERGLFPTGETFVDVKSFALSEGNESMDVAAEHVGIGRLVAISP